MKTTITLAFTLAATIFAAPALAIKIDMTPGLWEHSFTMTSQGGEMEKAMQEMQKQMANMPAEQRKMMEDMMAAQGISIGSKGTSVKVCMTQEDIDRGELPQHDDECKQEITEQGKNKFKATFVCNTNPPSTGSSEIHFTNSKNYTGNSIFTTEVKGKKEQMSMSQTGKWLSADCGAIKPIKY